MAIKFPLVNIRQAIDGTWNQNNVVEVVTVPASSPYIVHLDEVPDDGSHNSKVTITGLTESLTFPPDSGEFYVNYGTGRIQFHADEAGQSLSADYWQKGSLVEAEDINYINTNVETISANDTTLRTDVDTISADVLAINTDLSSLSADSVPLETLTNNHVPAGFIDHETTTLILEENHAGEDTFRVTLSGSDFPVYLDGELQYLSTQTVAKVGATSIRYYIFLSASGVLTISATEWALAPGEGFAGEAPVCTVLWDANNHQGFLEEERHHSWRDIHWHHWAHHSVGPRYSFGHAADGLAMTNPNSDEFATFQVQEGEVYDEDVRNDTPTSSAGQIFYHAADGTMVWEPTTSPYKLVGGIPQYDNGTGLADKTNSNTLGYFVTWVYTTNIYNQTVDKDKLCFIIGQDTDNEMTLDEAIDVPLPTLPVDFIVEWKLIYKMIFRRGNTGTITHIQNVDYRTAGALPGGGVQSSTIAAISVSYTPTEGGDITATNVQTAIEQVDAEIEAGVSILTALSGDYYSKFGTGDIIELSAYNEDLLTVSSSGGTLTLNVSAANNFSCTLSESITAVDFVGEPASGRVTSITVKFVQGAGAYTVDFTGIKFDGTSGAPTISTGSGDVDFLTFYNDDGGTNWYGFTAGQSMT